MRMLKCLLTNNPCYRNGARLQPKGVMVHSTGANNPYIKRYVQPDVSGIGKNKNGNDWNRNTKDVCVHAFIGKLDDGSIATVQTLPWNYKAWHCAYGPKGSGNNSHISFEICEDGLNDPVYFRAVYKEAVEFTAHLCRVYNLDPLKDGVVICHNEGYKRGIASDHIDVMHWFPKFGKTMYDFRSDVAKQIKAVDKKEDDNMTKDQILKELDDEYIKEYKDLPDWAKPTMRKLLDSGVINGGTSREENPNDIEMFLSDVKTIIVISRLINGEF